MPRQINDATWQRLQARASAQNLSVEDLLNHLLDESPLDKIRDDYILNYAPSSILITDPRQPDHPIVFANATFEQITGYSPDETIGRNCRFLQNDDRDQLEIDRLRSAIKAGEPCKVILRNYRKDGILFWNELYIAPVRDSTGQLTHFIGIQNDVTERVQTEQQLRDNEKKLSLALQAANAGVWTWDLATNRITWDAAIEAMHGFKRGEFGGDYSAWQAAVHPDDLPDAEAALQAALDGGTLFNEEFRVVWPDGTIRHILAQAIALRDEASGDPLQMIGVNSDITDRTHAEQALENSERQLRWLVQNMPILIDAFDDNNQIVMWNAECERVTGYRADEIVANPRAIEMLYPDPTYRQYVIEDAIQLGDQLKDREYTLTCKDGTEKIIRWSHIQAPYSIMRDTTWAVGIDVTEQHQAEEALRTSEEKYRLLVEHSYQGMVIAQANPIRLRFASQAMHTITGYTPEELMQFSPDALSQIIHPEDHDRFFGAFLTRLADKDLDPRGRYRIIHKNGEVRYVDLYSVRVKYEDEPATQTVFLDVTEQVEAERLKVRFQKEQEQNVLVQRVVSMLSHDLRTPLAIIASSQDMLHRYFERLSEEARIEKLDSIERQVRFATELLDDAVNTVQGPINTREFMPQPINLALLCQISVDEIQASQDGEHDMQFINRAEVEIVAVDEVLISRILVNLLSNAIKYSPVGSQIRLELDRRDNRIIIRVADQGMGISEDDLPHIFDPFFRSDAVAEISGTGLGLGIVKDCVDRHQGHVHIETSPGQGSIFTVELPIITAP